jgi:shikimate kinase
MKRILVTGMSGTGKSSVVRELARRGFEAVDLDTPEWSEWVPADAADSLTPAAGEDWVWRADRVADLLAAPRNAALFVSGCASNMEPFLPAFDHVVLLTAPLDILVERLAARSEGFGATALERAQVIGLVELVEPLLRSSADLELVTTEPLAKTVTKLARLAEA